MALRGGGKTPHGSRYGAFPTSLEPESVNSGKWCLEALCRFWYGEDDFWMPTFVYLTGKVFVDAQGRFRDGKSVLWMPRVIFFGTKEMVFGCPG